MNQEIRYYLEIEGEITYISSVEPLRKRDGEDVIDAKSGEQLEKRYIIIKGLDGVEYKVETIGSKPSRKFWLDYLASNRIGTQVKARLRPRSYSWTQDDGTKEIKNTFAPAMYGEKKPFEIVWTPDAEPEDVNDLPF